MFVLLAILAVAVNIFIVAYEEPALRRLFGSEYEAYFRSVRRWIPRLTPFDNAKPAAVLSADLD
jgi:protein-S-isoprenylcysteine O-methyltransferase Ste14